LYPGGVYNTFKLEAPKKSFLRPLRGPRTNFYLVIPKGYTNNKVFSKSLHEPQNGMWLYD